MTESKSKNTQKSNETTTQDLDLPDSELQDETSSRQPDSPDDNPNSNKDSSTDDTKKKKINYSKHYRDVKWRKEHESILIDWADKAMCYKWLHCQENIIYRRQNYWFTIPVIIISTLTGTANFAQDRVGSEYKNLAVMLVGSFNIFAGILTTISQYLGIAELNESHRVSSISWDKFYRNIKVELAKHPRERINPGAMLKQSKEEFRDCQRHSKLVESECGGCSGYTDWH